MIICMRCKKQYKTESDFLEDCYLNELNGMEEHECYREPITMVERRHSDTESNPCASVELRDSGDLDVLKRYLNDIFTTKRGFTNGEKEED